MNATRPLRRVEFFRVGGCVRDDLLGVRTKDIDFAVVAPSFAVMAEAVRLRTNKVFLTTEEFFTIRAFDPDLGAVDFVLCRKDGPSSDGRRPDFVEPGTIFDDLARRDFTVNAMAVSEAGFLIDPHKGQEDLGMRLLRFVGDPVDRLAEDALRAFRALRFSVTKGFTMTPETWRAIAAMRPEFFSGVSTERIREELLRAFAADSGKSIELLRRLDGMFDLVLERGIWFKPTTEKV